MARLTGLLFGVAAAVTLYGATAHCAGDADKPVPLGPSAVATQFADRTLQILNRVHTDHIMRPPLADLVRWAVEGIYREVGEQVPPGIAIRLDRAATLSIAGLKEVLASARERLSDRQGLFADRDIAAAVAGVMRRLEPNSDPKGWLNLDDTICSLPLYRRVGIGAVARKDGPKKPARVADIVLDGPAYRAGLRCGDRIVMVVDRLPPVEDRWPRWHMAVTAWNNDEENAKAVLGRPGTDAYLLVQRFGQSDVSLLKVCRQPCQPEVISGFQRRANDRWRFTVDEPGTIGYLRIGALGPGTHDALVKVLTSHPGVQGWILDLRFNEGGLLSEGIWTAEAFIGIRRVMTIYAGADKPAAVVYDGDEEAVLKNRPIVCLVNGRTQSSAEIVAACLQDQGKALIVGERTAGRAEIHSMQGVFMGSMTLKLTAAVFVRPSGKHLSRYMSAGRLEDEWGVVPDAGMECRLSQRETEQLAAAFRDAEAIYDPKFRPKAKVADRQLDLALSALRSRIDSK